VTSSFVSDNWAFTLFAKNLFNEDGIVAVFKEEAFGGDPEQNYFGNSQRNIISRPRTIGVSVSYNF
jgi:outer membrane receptor protein involved in Fe transport